MAKRDMAVPVETRVGHVQESEDTLASMTKPQLYSTGLSSVEGAELAHPFK